MTFSLNSIKSMHTNDIFNLFRLTPIEARLFAFVNLNHFIVSQKYIDFCETKSGVVTAWL